MRHLPMLLAAGEIANVSIFSPASPPAESIRYLAILVASITAGIFLLVEVALFYSVLRFRRGKAKLTTEPPQVYGSQAIEIAWTVAPALIVFVLSLVVARTEWDVRKTPPPPAADDRALYVTVIGHQWWWEYRYDTYDGRKLGFTTANDLHVPVINRTSDVGRRPVYLRLLSADVCHSFWVPRLAGKTDLIPGRENYMWFAAEEQGLYLGQCAEFCGTQHANMLLRVTASPVEEFEAWLDNQEKPAAQTPAEDALAAAGREIFQSQSCVNCHTVRGTAAAGTFAPDLTHFASRRTLASCELENTRENVRAWLVNPQALKPGCLMPAFGLSDGDNDRLAAYLESLK